MELRRGESVELFKIFYRKDGLTCRNGTDKGHLDGIRPNDRYGALLPVGLIEESGFPQAIDIAVRRRRRLDAERRTDIAHGGGKPVLFIELVDVGKHVVEFVLIDHIAPHENSIAQSKQ